MEIKYKMGKTLIEYYKSFCITKDTQNSSILIYLLRTVLSVNEPDRIKGLVTTFMINLNNYCSALD
jgi:hypothetical protein